MGGVVYEERGFLPLRYLLPSLISAAEALAGHLSPRSLPDEHPLHCSLDGHLVGALLWKMSSLTPLPLSLLAPDFVVLNHLLFVWPGAGNVAGRTEEQEPETASVKPLCLGAASTTGNPAPETGLVLWVPKETSVPPAMRGSDTPYPNSTTDLAGYGYESALVGTSSPAPDYPSSWGTCRYLSLS